MEKELPTRWQDVSFEKFIQLSKLKSDGEVLACILGFDPRTIRSAEIKNLEKIMAYLAFMQKQPEFDYLPKSINGYIIPQDLNFKSVGQYEDLKSIASDLANTGDLNHYCDMVAVYAMPNYLNASQAERNQFAKQFLKSPCTEVMAVGNFTLKKLSVLMTPSVKTYLKANTPISRLRQAMTVWLKNLVFTIRFYAWKLKHGIKGTN